MSKVYFILKKSRGTYILDRNVPRHLFNDKYYTSMDELCLLYKTCKIMVTGVIMKNRTI